MKFKIYVKHEGGKEWSEEYDTDAPTINYIYEEAPKDEINITVWGQDCVNYFNHTRRPLEKPREFIRAEYI